MFLYTTSITNNIYNEATEINILVSMFHAMIMEKVFL